MAQQRDSEEPQDIDPSAADEAQLDETGADPVEEVSSEETDAQSEELAKLRDQVLRTQAEMENLRRRNQRELENAHKFAVEKLAADLLPALDSFEKGIETTAGLEGEGVAAIAEGMQLSLKLLAETLAKHGLTQITPLGEPFDPQQHEAMAMVPNPDMEPNSVMDVLQPGYVLNGRVVRAAKVVVSKSPE